MRALIACLMLMLTLALPAAAEVNIVTAITLHERSGTVAPPYAWAWDVTFATDGRVSTVYCKGYAKTEPGCARRADKLTDDQLAVLIDLIPTLGRAPETPNPPIGGGARWATITPPEAPGVTPPTVILPAHPLPQDAARVSASLDALAALIPQGALDDTSFRAKAP